MAASMTVADVLRAVRKKIERRECWTQNVVARDSYGVPVVSTSEKACCWCLAGAIEFEVDNLQLWSDVICSFDEVLNGQNLVVFNETHTHAEVIEVLDRTIAVVEAAT